MPKISLVIAHPDRMHRRRLADTLAPLPQIDLVAETRDLMSTYAEVEEREPMAVIIAEGLAQMPEFEVMRALFSALDVRWLVVTAEGGSERNVTSHPWNRKSDLFAVDADAAPNQLLGTLETLTRTARHQGPATVPASSQRPSRPAPATAANGRFILIGASTGGVDALLTVLSSFPAACPPTFIVQHTGSGFGESLARLLDRQCQAVVRTARDGDSVKQGEIVVAAGCRSHLLLAGGKPMRTTMKADGPVSGHMPSVDAMFRSALPGAQRAVAALLTGMGRDGANGLLALRQAGARTIAQDEASCTVYGMPRAAAELGAAEVVLPLTEIGPALLRASTSPAPGHSQRMSAT